jgi:hypothetical protein
MEVSALLVIGMLVITIILNIYFHAQDLKLLEDKIVILAGELMIREEQIEIAEAEILQLYQELEFWEFGVEDADERAIVEEVVEPVLRKKAKKKKH